MSVVWIYWWLVWFDVNKHTGSYLHRQIYQHHLYTYLGYIHDKKEILVDDNTGMAMVIDLVCTTWFCNYPIFDYSVLLWEMACQSACH
jgi:hypothetical protein